MLYATASQTVGPFLHIGLAPLTVARVATADVAGEHVTIAGTLVDGLGAPVPDGLIEIWQANAAGRYRHPEDQRALPLTDGFTGFGRVATDAQGGFRFETIKPGRVPAPAGGLQAPHILVSVFARGILKRMATRIYFPDDPGNADDPILQQVPAARRATLIAQPLAADRSSLRFNIVLHGRWLGQDETVFFDL